VYAALLLCCLSRLVKLDPDVAARTLAGKKGAYVIAAYPESIGASVIEVEHGLHMVVICTYGGDAPPFKDDQLMGFMAEASHLTDSRQQDGALATSAAHQAVGYGDAWLGVHGAAGPSLMSLTPHTSCKAVLCYSHCAVELSGAVLYARR
jgi:hypothetical protein